MRNFYLQKLVLAGNNIETFEYEDPVLMGFKCKKQSAPKQKPKDPARVIISRLDSLRRTNSKLKRLVNCNEHLDKFITLTFEENLTDISKANNIFHRFIDRLKYLHGSEIGYIAVMEFQKRGAIHYHCLMNIPYMHCKTLQKVWNNGFVKIKKVKKLEGKSMYGYISKYIGKDNDDHRLAGKKRYLYSRNLKRPVIYTGKNHNEMKDFVLSRKGIDIDKVKPDFEKEFKDPMRRKVKYKHFTGNSTL